MKKWFACCKMKYLFDKMNKTGLLTHCSVVALLMTPTRACLISWGKSFRLLSWRSATWHTGCRQTTLRMRAVLSARWQLPLVSHHTTNNQSQTSVFIWRQRLWRQMNDAKNDEWQRSLLVTMRTSNWTEAWEASVSTSSKPLNNESINNHIQCFIVVQHVQLFSIASGHFCQRLCTN